jgi:Tol biopolymer transport system component
VDRPRRAIVIALVLGVGACSAGGQEPDPGAVESGTAAGSHSSSKGTARATATAATTTAPLPGEPWLAYQDSDFRIRLVRPDGRGDHALDEVTTGAEDNPDWSPDGSRLTFVGSGDRSDANAGLWVVGADGAGLAQLVECVAPCQYLDDPAWSPDGSQIMFSRMAPGPRTGGSLQSVDVATRKVRTVLRAKPGEFYSGVRYAPDGKAVVLERVSATKEDYEDVRAVRLTRIDLTRSPPRTTTLTDPTLFAQTPDWSPLGDRIVYAAQPEAGDAGDDLFLSRPDGTGRRRLTFLLAAGGGALHPDFTNDGSGVVFLGAEASGSTSFMRVDVASGTVSPGFTTGRLAGHHPRSRPVP